jgi:hypothetical protein
MAEPSGKQLKEDLLAAREFAADLGNVLQNEVAGAAKSTQEKAQEIADSLKGQVDTSAKLGTLVQQRNDYIKEQIALGRIINQNLVDALDTEIKMLEELKEHEDKADKIKEIQEEWKSQGDELKDKFENFKNTFTAIVTDPAAALTAALAYIIKQVMDVAKATRDFANEMGTGYGESLKAAGQAKIISKQYQLMGMEMEDVVSAQQESLRLGMSMEQVLDGTAESVAYMSVRYGVASAEAAKLNKIMLGMADESQAGADAMMDQAVALAKANKVAPGPVIQDMAENYGEFAAAGKEGFHQMVKTSIVAKKLGMTMSDIANIADGILNIESSIEAEMNAQVMTGKRINLNHARELANRNDLVGMTKELVRQLGTYEEFTNMTRLEQDAWAASVGKTRGELSKMLQNAHKLDDLTEAQKEHYNETGEILEKNDSWFNAQNIQMAAAIATGLVAIGQLVTQGVNLGKNLLLEKQITSEKQKQTTAGKGGGKGGGTPGKGFNIKSALKAAAGMLIISAAMWVFAQAAKAFGDDINWGNVLIGSAILVGLGIAAAILGKFSSQIIQGSLALLILGIALIPAAFAFSLLADIDPMQMIAFAGALIILGIAAAIFGIPVVLMAILLGAVAILALGLAIIPFAYAMSMLEGVDVMGAMTGIVTLAMAGPLLAAAGIGMTLLGLGIWPFIWAMEVMGPLVPVVLEFAEAMSLLAPPLASLAAVAGGLMLVGPGLALVGMALFPLSLGLLALSLVESYIPLLGQLGEYFAILGPPMAMMASAGAGLLMIGPALAMIGLGLIPLAFGLAALGFVKGLIPAFGKLAPILTEMAPALVAIGAVGAGLVLAGLGFTAFAAGILLLVPALYALMPLMPMLLLLGGLVGSMGGLFGGEEESEGEGEGAKKEGPGNAEIVAKLDQLIAVIQQPGVINMDGKKVGEVMHMAKGLSRM